MLVCPIKSRDRLTRSDRLLLAVWFGGRSPRRLCEGAVAVVEVVVEAVVEAAAAALLLPDKDKKGSAGA